MFIVNNVPLHNICPAPSLAMPFYAYDYYTLVLVHVWWWAWAFGKSFSSILLRKNQELYVMSHGKAIKGISRTLLYDMISSSLQISVFFSLSLCSNTLLFHFCFPLQMCPSPHSVRSHSPVTICYVTVMGESQMPKWSFMSETQSTRPGLSMPPLSWSR
jgi:hypothetical protein